jgi:hypothetical protein
MKELLGIDVNIKNMYKAAIAYQQLNICYRIGKQPSEKLFNDLEFANKILELYKGIN